MKFKLLNDPCHTKIVDGRTLYRIQATSSFDRVNKGDIGGWVEHEGNLSQLDNCWIYDEGVAMNNTVIEGCVSVNNSVIKGNTYIFGEKPVYINDSEISDSKLYFSSNSRIYRSRISNESEIIGGGFDSIICDGEVINSKLCSLMLRVSHQTVVTDCEVVLTSINFSDGKVTKNVKRLIDDAVQVDRIYVAVNAAHTKFRVFNSQTMMKEIMVSKEKNSRTGALAVLDLSF